MKHYASLKHLMLVVGLMSLSPWAQAGSVYRQMLSITNSMQQQADRENLSNTYGKKLSNNLDRLDQDLNRATALPGGRNSGGRGVSNDDGIELLIQLAAVAANEGALQDFPAAAKQNIIDTLDEALDTLTDEDLINDASFVLNTLGGDLQDAPRGGHRKPTRRRMRTSYQGLSSSYTPSRQRGGFYDRRGRRNVGSNDSLEKIRRLRDSDSSRSYLSLRSNGSKSFNQSSMSSLVPVASSTPKTTILGRVSSFFGGSGAKKTEAPTTHSLRTISRRHIDAPKHLRGKPPIMAVVDDSPEIAPATSSKLSLRSKPIRHFDVEPVGASAEAPATKAETLRAQQIANGTVEWRDGGSSPATLTSGAVDPFA